MWIKTSFHHFMANGPAPVVQKLDSAIQWISIKETNLRYPLDRDLHVSSE